MTFLFGILSIIKKLKYQQLFKFKEIGQESATQYIWLETMEKKEAIIRRD